MNSYEEIKNILVNIPEEQPIIISGHENADMDSIGASLALAHFLNDIGKKDVNVLISEKDMYKIMWFNNNKFISTNVEKENYVLIMVDVDRKQRLAEFESYFDKANIVINIDHHESNKKHAKYLLIDERISSTCEILFNLFSCFDKKLNKEIASLLYAGILTDTTCFSHRLTAKTMKIISSLLEYEIDYQYITKKTYLERSMLEIYALSKILNSIKYDVFHYVVIDKKEPVFSSLEYSMLFKKMVPILKNIQEVKVLGIFLIDGDKVFGEFKSNIDIDVSVLARELGGGGHRKSAGFTSSLSLEKILKISKKYIQESIANT